MGKKQVPPEFATGRVPTPPTRKRKAGKVGQHNPIPLPPREGR